MTRPIAVQILAEGFLHPAPALDREVVDDNGIAHVPVAGLDTDIQFFRCRVDTDLTAIAAEYVLADAPALTDREMIGRVLCARFPNSTTLFLRSQAIGRAVIDCPADSSLAQDAAAAVAVVMCSAAWDDSAVIAVEGGGSKHAFAVRVDDSGHWAQPIQDEDELGAPR